jgi:hypothetical protein
LPYFEQIASAGLLANSRIVVFPDMAYSSEGCKGSPIERGYEVIGPVNGLKIWPP